MGFKYRLDIAYEGTDFSGWQLQTKDISIQGTLEEVLAITTRQSLRVIGSSRTDAGVHATGQVAHFVSGVQLECKKLLYSLNALLPPTIRVLALQEVPDAFHAQFSVVSKEYHYHLWLAKTLDPFLRMYRYHFPHPLSIPCMQKAAALCVGTHDFRTFANVGSSAKTTVRTLYRIDCIEERGGIRLEFEGNGFLYKMVRNLVGVLIECGTGKRKVEEIPLLFEKSDRRAGGYAVPPQGLFLVKVNYNE